MIKIRDTFPLLGLPGHGGISCYLQEQFGLLEGMLLCHASLLLLAWGEAVVRTLLGPGDRLLIDGFDGGRPGEELLIVRILLFELMPIA